MVGIGLGRVGVMCLPINSLLVFSVVTISPSQYYLCVNFFSATLIFSYPMSVWVLNSSWPPQLYFLQVYADDRVYFGNFPKPTFRRTLYPSPYSQILSLILAQKTFSWDKNKRKYLILLFTVVFKTGSSLINWSNNWGFFWKSGATIKASFIHWSNNWDFFMNWSSNWDFFMNWSSNWDFFINWSNN